VSKILNILSHPAHTNSKKKHPLSIFTIFQQKKHQSMKLPILLLSFFVGTSALSAQSFHTDTVGDRQIQTYFYDGGGVFVRWERKGEAY
jgi:hypothetical protein